MKPFCTLLTVIILSFCASAQVKHRFVVAANVFELNGFVRNDSAKISWRVSDNEKGNVFEVEKSLDGINFETSGMVFASDKPGIEDYEFNGIRQKEATAFYRLKIFNEDRSSAYSKVIQLKNNPETVGNVIRLFNNPSDSKLGFTYQSESKGTSEVLVHSISGVTLYSGRVFTNTGSNLVTIDMNGAMQRGVYVLEVRNGKERMAVKFVKG